MLVRIPNFNGTPHQPLFFVNLENEENQKTVAVYCANSAHTVWEFAQMLNTVVGGKIKIGEETYRLLSSRLEAATFTRDIFELDK